MEILTCDGLISQSGGTPQCSGSWQVVQVAEFATQYREAFTMSREEFSDLSGTFVMWFVVAFGVRLIRRMFNT
ncbi:hypothetical protein [Marinobacter daepoensis]|uniref:hypothetical protein n=1 Tax=Marinobacter daepoensis TaxID=262077 RepID=UPI00041FE0DC|nr:hypothetical protein [Marinobacter daepoensis]